MFISYSAALKTRGKAIGKPRSRELSRGWRGVSRERCHTKSAAASEGGWSTFTSTPFSFPFAHMPFIFELIGCWHTAQSQHRHQPLVQRLSLRPCGRLVFMRGCFSKHHRYSCTMCGLPAEGVSPRGSRAASPQLTRPPPSRQGHSR